MVGYNFSSFALRILDNTAEIVTKYNVSHMYNIGVVCYTNDGNMQIVNWIRSFSNNKGNDISHVNQFQQQQQQQKRNEM